MYQTSAFAYEVPQEPRKTLVTSGETFEQMMRQLEASNVVVFDHETKPLPHRDLDPTDGRALRFEVLGREAPNDLDRLPVEQHLSRIESGLVEYARDFDEEFVAGSFEHGNGLQQQDSFDERQCRYVFTFSL